MKIRIFLLFLTVTFFANAQTDTCAPKTCTGFQNKDSYQIYAKLQQIKNILNSISTDTTTVTGNWFRQDSATSSFNRLNGTQTSINAGIQSGISLFARQTTLNSLLGEYNNGSGNSALFDTITGQNISIPNTLVSSSGITAGDNLQTIRGLLQNPSPIQSVGVSTYSTSVSAAGINTKLAGTLTVTPTGTTSIAGSVTVTNTVTVAAVQTTETITDLHVTVSGTGTVTTGAHRVSITNSGSANATVNGVTFPPGLTKNYGGMTGILVPQITYDCLTSTLEVTVER